MRKFNLLPVLCKVIILSFFAAPAFTPLLLNAQPLVSAVSPQQGVAGSTITLTGKGFSTTASANTVFFGTIKATVIAASATSLTVKVPAGASGKQISVTVNSLTGYATQLFHVTFAGGNAFTPGSFVNIGHADSAQGIETTGMCNADFDGDGKPDIAIVNRVNNTLSVYRNTAVSGMVTFEKPAELSTGHYPIQVSCADFDGDGKFDIAVVNQQDSTISVFKNNSTNGHIAFAARVNFPAGPPSASMAIADFDLDGKPDIITVGGGALKGSYVALKNATKAGALSFTTAVRVNSPLFSFDGVATGDFDNDGKTDFATLNILTNSISIFRNSGTSAIGFATPFAISSNGRVLNNFAVGDVTGDGKPEIVCSYGENIPYTENNLVSVFKNNSNIGSLSFTGAANFTIANPGVHATGLTIEDLDGDNLPDIAAVNAFNSLALLKNTTTGNNVSFSGKVEINVLGNGGLLTGDFDTDGKQDIVIDRGLLRAVVLHNAVNEPYISSFTPETGKKGDNVTLTGANFSGVTQVNFGGKAATAFTINSATSMTATVGDGYSGSIQAVNTYGKGSIDGFEFAGPPVVTSFTPARAAAGTTITITGYNFVHVSAVSFGGVPANYIVTGPNTLQAVVADGATGSISVSNPYGTGTAAGFLYIDAPAISSFTPQAGGPDTVITIKGSNFTGASMVTIGGAPVQSFTVVSDTVITAAAGTKETGNIEVTAPGGKGASQDIFYCKPIVTSFTPTVTGANEDVTINGYNFTGATRVTFGGVDAAKFQVVSDNIISAFVGDASSGAVAVTAPGGTGTMDGFVFHGAPIITKFTPRSGVGGAVVNIFGRHFTGTTAVSIGAPVSFTVVSDTLIKAIASSTVDMNNALPVMVTTPYGTVLGDEFLYTKMLAISSVSTYEAAAGTQVTILGTNFGKTAADNAVYFGPVKANIVFARADTLIVTVPASAARSKITVNNNTTGLSISTIKYFNPVFAPTQLKTSVFSGTTILKTPGVFSNIATADFDGDGKIDIVTADTANNSFSLYRNTSNAKNVSFASRFAVPALHPLKVWAMDIDGDGKKDLFAFLQDTSLGPDWPGDMLAVYKNESTPGHFSFSRKLYKSGNGAAYTNAYQADVDNDGKQDILIIGNQAPVSVILFYNRSTKDTIGLEYSYIPLKRSNDNQYLWPFSLAIDDVNGDGISDLTVTGHPEGNYIAISIYSGITQSGAVANIANRFSYIGYDGGAYADIDGDDRLDLVEGGGYRGFNVLQKDWYGFYFMEEPYYYKGITPPADDVAYHSAMQLCDVDGDGKVDVVASGLPGDNGFAIFRNTSTAGNINFENGVPFAAGVDFAALTTADIDGDGKPDIIITRPESNEIRVLRNGAIALASTALNLSGVLQNNQAVLQWKAVTDKKVADFVIERSIDAVNFTQVWLTNAASSNQQYNYTDAGITALLLQHGTVYYRIKMTGADGKITYSNIVALHAANSSAPQAYPNPVHNQLHIIIPASLHAKTLNVYNNAGQLLLIKNVNLLTATDIDVSGFAAGNYYVQIINANNEKYQLHFIKQ